jgi:hypothetical protein
MYRRNSIVNIDTLCGFFSYDILSTRTMLSPRIKLALFVALVYLLVASPWTFDKTSALIGEPLGMPFVAGGVPTSTGLVVHAAVIAGLTFAFSGYVFA